MESPYQNQPVSAWKAITDQLVTSHPLDGKEAVDVILEAWECIFQSKICGLQIGKDIFPNPQMMGFFVESLTAAKLAGRYPKTWKHGREKFEKDLVCLSDDAKSIEVKSSSNPKQIFGNRSYAQAQSDVATKDKGGFYLTINFEKFEQLDGSQRPDIRLIRFGFLDHSDWRGQKSEKGQQANLSPEVYQNKFVVLYEKPKPARPLKKA